MEIPDVIVVNKADHPMTDTMVREVRERPRALPRPRGLEGADPAHRGGAGGGGRGAGGEDRRAPRPHRGRRRRSRSGAPATSAARCSGSPARGCGGGSRRPPPTTPRPRRCSTGSSGASSTPPAPPPSCSRGRSMADVTETIPEAGPPSQAEAPPGSAGSSTTSAASAVGRVHAIYVDAESGEPAWLIAALEQSAGCSAGAARCWSRCRCAIAPAPPAGSGPPTGGRRSRGPDGRPDEAAAARARARDLLALRDRAAGRPRRRGDRARRGLGDLSAGRRVVDLDHVERGRRPGGCRSRLSPTCVRASARAFRRC